MTANPPALSGLTTSLPFGNVRYGEDEMTANFKSRTLFVADNLPVMRGMNSESVDLIATDPPFNTKRIHNAPLGSRTAQQRYDDRWKWDEVTDEWQDLIAADYPVIKEIIEAAAVIEGGSIDHRTGKISTGRIKNSIAAYIAWMAPRVIEMYRLLKPTGSLYLHCDPAANSYLRLLLDSVFGRPKFRSEIIWRRSNAHNKEARQYGPIHDTILFYSKSDKHTFHPGTRPYAKAYIDDRFKKSDERGKWQTNYLTGPEVRHGESGKPWGGFDPTKAGRHWAISKSIKKFLPDNGKGMTSLEMLDALHEKGLIIFPKKKGGQPMYKQYVGDGVLYQDIWAYQPNTRGVLYNSVENIDEDVKWIENENEKANWTTQKPIGVYRRIIESSSNENDMVLDPFCGCATTCAAAEILGRQWVGIDIDPVAETETKDRLSDITSLDPSGVLVRKSRIKRTDIPHISDQKMRVSLWEKQGRQCANPYCDSEQVRSVDLDLDHRIPKIRGGDDDIHNRIGLCGNCNNRKGKKAWGLFLNEERAKQPHPTR